MNAAEQLDTSPPKVLRPPRGPRVREVVKECAAECALQPSSDEEDRVYLRSWLRRPVRESDWDWFMRSREDASKDLELRRREEDRAWGEL